MGENSDDISYSFYYGFDTENFFFPSSLLVCNLIVTAVQIGGAMRYFYCQMERLVGDMEGGVLLFIGGFESKELFCFSL